MRERHLSDTKIMGELEVNSNAYYTLRSRLNQKIEEYLLQQMESPRTDLLKKVANINEVIFTKKRAIAVATLQKLEKELADYDLSHELTIVYKQLKKLHLHSPDYFTYSQLYNKHVAFTLAIDKAEDMLADYFKKYGYYTLGGEEKDKVELSLINAEMNNVCSLYQSHRLYVNQACMNIFHRLFVEEDKAENESEPIEDMLQNIEKIFVTYQMDSTYYNLMRVFEFLKYEYYTHYKVYRKAEKYYEDVNEEIAVLLSNYSLFTYPAQFLLSKIERAVRMGTEAQLYAENEEMFEDYDNDPLDLARHVTYVIYRAVSGYYAHKYEEAARILNTLLNNVSLKKYPIAHIEIKCLLALHYLLMKDTELFNQLVNSVQRQIRIMGKDDCEHIIQFIKLMKASTNPNRRERIEKVKSLSNKFQKPNGQLFSCVRLINMNEDFVNRLCN
jgi:hypothetical protein